MNDENHKEVVKESELKVEKLLEELFNRINNIITSQIPINYMKMKNSQQLIYIPFELEENL